MLYDLLTYTCESTDRLSQEIPKFQTLISKTGTTHFEVIDLLNRTGIILAQFQSHSELLRGQAINAEMFKQMIDANVIDGMTAQNHQGRTLYSFRG